jgi:hypothetical protein
MHDDLKIAAQYAVEPVNVKIGSGYRAISKVKLLTKFCLELQAAVRR